MTIKPGIVPMLVAACCAVPGSMAQSVAPAAAEAAPMARALEQADGPKRRILEAARLKAAQSAPPVRQRGTGHATLGHLGEPAMLPQATPALPSVPTLPLAELPPPAAAPAELPLSPLAPMVLLQLVEPELPVRLLSQRIELPLDLMVQADGSVERVVVRAPVPSALAERVIAAVRQWRYAPLAAPRSHRVTLVLNPA